MKKLILVACLCTSLAHADLDVVENRPAIGIGKVPSEKAFDAEHDEIARLLKPSLSSPKIKPEHDEIEQLIGSKSSTPKPEPENLEDSSDAFRTPKAADWWKGRPNRIHRYQNKQGEVIYSTTPPILSLLGKKKKKPSVQDLVYPEKDEYFKYIETHDDVKINERVYIPAKQRYSVGMCKLGSAFVFCYKPSGMIKAKSYTYPKTTSKKISSTIILKEATQAAHE